MTTRADDRLGVPLEGGPSEALVRERASATPRTSVTRSLQGAERERGSLSRGNKRSRAAAVEVPLHELQHWFAAAVMDPRGVAAALEQGSTGVAGAEARVVAGELHVPLSELER